MMLLDELIEIMIGMTEVLVLFFYKTRFVFLDYLFCACFLAKQLQNQQYLTIVRDLQSGSEQSLLNAVFIL